MKTTLRKALPMLLCLILCICLVPAAWAESTYTIRFDANGGYGSMDAIMYDPNRDVSLPSNRYYLEQHSFVGWNTRADGRGNFYLDKQTIPAYEFVEEVTLYAQWEQTTFTIKFDPNGGSGVMEPQSFDKNFDSKILLAPNIYTKVIPGTMGNGHYAFAGWNTRADDTGISYEDESVIQSDDINWDMTLYAQWDTIIAFDPNGGYGSMEPQKFYIGNEMTLNPNNFSRANYVFSHWNTKADGSGISYPDQGDITPTDSITLYAQWVKTFYSVNYDKNGGGGIMPSGSVQKYRSGTVKECAFNPPTYYTVFTEWNTSPDGTGTSYRPGDPIWSDDIPNDITLYAIWREKLNVWFYPGEGSGTATSVEEPEGSEVRLPTPASFGFTAPSGQTFAYWQDMNVPSEYYFNGEKVALSKDTRLEAVWADTVKITYHANGGTVSVNSGGTTVKKESTDQAAAKGVDYKLYTADQLKLTRDGYRFEGWMSTASGSTVKYTDGQIIDEGFSQNTTIYAKWKRVKIADTATISGSVTGSDPNAVWGETLTAMVVDPVFKTGFTYTWKVEDAAVQMGESNMFEVLPEYYGREIICTVSHPQAENEVVSNIKIVGVYAAQEEDELRIVNSGTKYPGLYYETPLIFGAIPGSTYYKDGKAATVPESAASGAFEITEPGVYVFGDTTYVATQWWTIGYSTSSETTTGFGTGSGTVSMRRGITTMTGSTTIRDSATGEILIKPYHGISGYANQWLVRDGSGITDITLNIRPSSGSYSRVSRNGGEPSSTNAEQTISLGMINEPEMYNIVFSRTDLSVPVAPIDAEHFPDPVFRRYVQARDTDNDGMLSNIEINRVISMSCSNLGISSLKGIELFDKLETLFCQSNDVSELDVSACTSLKELFCSDNTLAVLKLNPGITSLYCSGNALTSLDLSVAPLLENLDCSRNVLPGLDLSDCSVLRTLSCYGNLLQALDLRENAMLQTLDSSDNMLTALYLGSSPVLISINCSGNLLTELDLGGSPALASLHCADNKLGSLDLSGKERLRTLNCSGNNLTELTLDGCNSLATLSCEKNALSELDVSACTNLRRLNCSQNHLMSLELSDYTLLTTLSCENNDLLFLRVTGCPALKALTCQRNALSELDLGGCSALITLMESTDPEIHGGVVSYSSGSSSIILSFDEQIMVDKHIITYEFILPSALTEISDEAFSGGAFSSVVIPESVTKIGSRAFADCPNLRYVQILGPTIDIAPDAFENVDGLTVYYKFGSALTRVDAQALGCAFVQMP